MDAETAEITRRLDTLILLMVRDLYLGKRLQDIVLPLANLGLTANQIAAALDANPKNVANRLSEARRTMRESSEGEIE
ncbi:MAG TPA: hypothetical protein VFS30_12595 [Dehalococcoidia bacterium]|nr:hypothetical protein [Dehalococcoidia bacterium]